MRLTRMCLLIEADLQNLAVIADEPSGFRICKSDCPVTAHLRQLEPRLPFIGRPRRRAGTKIRLSLGRDHDGLVVVMVEMIFPIPIVPIVVLVMPARISE